MAYDDSGSGGGEPDSQLGKSHPISGRVTSVLSLGLKVAFHSRGLDTPKDYKVTLQAFPKDLKVGLEENGQGDDDLKSSRWGNRRHCLAEDRRRFRLAPPEAPGGHARLVSTR
jgi:hypothetical protein